MGALKVEQNIDEVKVTRLIQSAIGFNTLSDLVEVAAKESLTYEPDTHEDGESLIIKCYTLEDAEKLFKRIKQDAHQYLSHEEETGEAEEKKEELPT